VIKKNTIEVSQNNYTLTRIAIQTQKMHFRKFKMLYAKQTNYEVMGLLKIKNLIIVVSLPILIFNIMLESRIHTDIFEYLKS
jgi:hypothetical protein